MTEKAEVWLALAGVCLAILILFSAFAAFAHDPAHHELDEWYANLKQPDSNAPCCGEDDSYWCDDYHIKAGADGVKNLYCTVQDERDIKRRAEIPNGTEVLIPPNKVNKDPNPTGHSILFGSPIRSYGADGSEHIEGVNVWCFVLGGGV